MYDKSGVYRTGCVGVGVLDDPNQVNISTNIGLSRVRVSSGHLCEAEAPTEPAGEIRQPLRIVSSTNYIQLHNISVSIYRMPIL